LGLRLLSRDQFTAEVRSANNPVATRALRRPMTIVLVMAVVCTGVVVLPVLGGEQQARKAKAVRVRGRVLDSVTGKPIAEAHLKMLPTETGSWSTDERGQFAFWIPSNVGSRVEIEREQYASVAVDLRGGFLGDIPLGRLASSEWQLGGPGDVMPASQLVAPAIVTADSGPRFSGNGYAWSAWYRLGVGKAPAGYTIQKVEFWLSGDRGCGAWAECRELLRSDSEVVWKFRLRGHDEVGAPRKAVSIGHLRVTYRPQ
jgi:hypothetical protein